MPMTDIEKLTAERMESVRKLLDDYAAFQRGRPDLPQGEIGKLSKHDLKELVDAFALEQARPTLERLSGADQQKYEKLILRSFSGKSVTLGQLAKYTGK
jgi:hypothetical protein